jgi:ribosomal protein S18 acetylase RimI-like enzyme
VIVVRFARRVDAPAIAALARAFTKAEGGGPNPMSAAAVLARGFGRARLFRLLVALDDGAIVGYALVYPGYDAGEDSPGLHLSDLIVARGARRNGVGRALMAAVMREATAIDAGWITWFVRPRNRGARAFYRAVAAKRLPSIPLYLDVPRRSAGRQAA